MKTLLYNPFECLSEKRLLIFGTLLLIVAIMAAMLLSIRFDSALDLHMVSETVPLQTALIDLSVSILSMILMLFAAGKIYNGKTRIIDIVTTVFIARIPFLLITPFNLNQYMGKLGTLILQTDNISALSTNDLILLSTNSILTLLILVWFVVLLWNGFKTATHAKGAKAVVLFVIGIISAEAISKVLLNLLA